MICGLLILHLTMLSSQYHYTFSTEYFSLEYTGKFYRFNDTPNGRSNAKRIVPKTLKTVFGYLR